MRECQSVAPRARLNHLRHGRRINDGMRVRRAAQRRDAARDRGARFGLDGRLVFEPRFAQPRTQIHEARADDLAAHVQDPRRREPLGRPADAGNKAVIADKEIGDFVPVVGRVHEPPAADQQRHDARLGSGETPGDPPMISAMMAMRTAMPFVTCGRITERGPSATAESISSPRFIGPGCMTIASGLAYASFSGVRPYRLKYSCALGTSEPCMRSRCRRSIMMTSTPSRPARIS